MSKLIPWDMLEELYGSKLSDGMGRPGKNVRIAFGARIIKRKLNLNDEEVVERIRENPYLQYFIGLEEFRSEALFDASLMTTFRKRFKLVDVLWEQSSSKEHKPRTYRKKARESYLAVSKKRRPKAKTIRNAIKQQLGFLNRALSHIDKLLADGNVLNSGDAERLEVLRAIHRQQREMYV